MSYPQIDWRDYLHIRLKTDWSLSYICRTNCECYFLRHWSREYFADKFLTHPDHLEYDGIKYRIRFHDSSLGIVQTFEQVALSFRKPKPELNLPAYVLVKGIAS